MFLMTRTRAIGVLATSAALVGSAIFTGTASADSGGLDTSYGTGGRTTVPTPAGTANLVDSLQLADGSIVAVGTRGAAGSRDAIVVKFQPNGGLDATFGTGGVANLEFGGDDRGLGISARSGGGFVVAGSDGPDVATGNGTVAKLNANGVLDPAWGIAGVATYTGTGIAAIDRAAELPGAGGDVVYAATVTDTSLALGRASGSTILAPGLFFQPATSNANDTFVALEQRSDGRWIAVITSLDGPAPSAGSIVTIDFDGLAPSNGNETVTARANPFVVRDAYLVAGDKVQVIGSIAPSPAGTQRGAVWRHNADGTLDPSFGTGGEIQLPIASEAWTPASIATTTGGLMYISGDLGTDRVRTVRLNPNFTLDTTFAQGGIADRSYGAAPNRVENVFTDPQDRPVVLGSFAGAPATFRIERFDYASTRLGAVTYSPSFVQRLNTVTFSYSVTNAGPDASDVTVDIDLPATYEGQAFSPSAGVATPVADGTGATWVVTRLASGSTATLTATGRPGDVGTLTTTATIIGQSSIRVGEAPLPMSTSVIVYGAATPRDDVITATPRNDVIDALAGNDIVYALAGNDDIDGNVGDDQLFGQEGDDVLKGGEGTDFLDGASGNDTLDAGPGVTNERLLGGTGNDSITANDGDNVIEAGDGNDTVLAGGGTNSIDGAAGSDRITSGAGKDVITAGAGTNVVAAGDGDNTVTGGNEGNRVTTGSGTDIVAVGNGTDTVVTGAGNDRVTLGNGRNVGSTGDGNDTLVSGTGNDKLDGGAGNDLVDAGAGNDSAKGGAGNDRVYGRAGNDVVDGAAGNDLVFGGPGNDRVTGGIGADRLYGDTGNDYLIAQGEGDRLYGGPGRDRIDGGAGSDKLYGGTGDDWINGKTGNDVIDGNNGNDWLRGYLGNDVISGGNGRDLLNGGAGTDTLLAGADNDIIRADDGKPGDVIDCGSGWDIVYANSGDRIASNCEYVKYDLPAGTPYVKRAVATPATGIVFSKGVKFSVAVPYTG